MLGTVPCGSDEATPLAPARPALAGRIRCALYELRWSIWMTLAPALRCDKPLWALLAVYALLWLPLLPRQVSNPRMLASLINDEVLLTQEMVAMRHRPYGNPANYDLMNPNHRPLPAYWGTIQYYGACYYGGTYLGTSLLFLLPFKALGLRDFPMAPFVLRTVTMLAGMISLMVLYNLGKRLSGRWTGFLAAFWLLLDYDFAYYSSIIHPDTTMLALSLLALWVAVRHAQVGSRGTLIGVGVLIGLGHGAKMGGPWLVPMAILSAAWGVSATDPELTRLAWCRRVAARVTLLGFSALAAFAFSTPYAFLDSYYFKVLSNAWQVYQTSPFAEVTPMSWLYRVWEYEGPNMCYLALASLALVPLYWLCNRQPALLVLAATLGLSQLAFYALTVKVWVVMGYLLPALALFGLFAADLLSGFAQLLARVSRWPAIAVAPAAAYILLPAVQNRALGVAAHALAFHCVERSTPFYVNRWAQEHLPHETRLVHDDIAYFDPAVFPNVHMHGGLLTYADLERDRPEYFMISGSIYDSPHYKELRKTQNFTRGKEEVGSVLLYQDLLDRGGSPEAEHIATFAHTRPPCNGAVENVIGLTRMALGLDDYLTGPEIRLYRYRPAR